MKIRFKLHRIKEFGGFKNVIRKFFEIKWEVLGSVIFNEDLKRDYPTAEIWSTTDFVFQKPNYLSAREIPLYEYYQGYHRVFDPVFYSELENVELLGPYAVGVKNGEVILSTQIGNSTVLKKCAPSYFNNSWLHKVDSKLEYCLSLVSLYNNSEVSNYFHWLMESACALSTLEKLKCHQSVLPQIIVPETLVSWQKDILNELIEEGVELVPWKFKRATIKKLLVFSGVRTSTANFYVLHPLAIDWLVAKMTAGRQYPQSENIIISRRSASVRRVVNEEYLIDRLQVYGFKLVFLEELTFREQVNLLRSAKCVVSSHGAGLTNILFCQSGTKVFEIFGDNASIDRYGINPTEYFKISNYRKLEHHIVFGKTIDLDGVRFDVKLTNDNIQYILNNLDA